MWSKIHLWDFTRQLISLLGMQFISIYSILISDIMIGLEILHEFWSEIVSSACLGMNWKWSEIQSEILPLFLKDAVGVLRKTPQDNIVQGVIEASKAEKEQKSKDVRRVNCRHKATIHPSCLHETLFFEILSNYSFWSHLEEFYEQASWRQLCRTWCGQHACIPGQKTPFQTKKKV